MWLRPFRANVFGPVEGVRDAQANILRSEMAVKPCFPQPLRWLLSGSAKNELSPGFVDLIGEFLQRLKASGIDGRHVPEPEDNDGWKVVQARNNRVEFVGCTEEERAMDSEDAHAGESQRVNHPGHRSFRTGTDIGSRSGDGSRSRESAE
jgi:hypothetical protein